MLDDRKLRIVVVVNVEEVKDSIEGITKVDLHAEALIDLMEADYGLVFINFGVYFVMQIFRVALGVTLQKGGLAAECITYAKQIDFFIGTTTHIN